MLKNSLRFVTTAILISVALSCSAAAQFRLENWRAYTSMRNVVAIDTGNDGKIWAATTGGVFSYDPASGEYEEFRNIDQLLSIDITSIAYNSARDEVYAGARNGIIDIIAGEGTIRHITDIRSSDFPRANVNKILFHDGLAIIAAGFGIAVFDPEEMIFTETILRLGDFPPNTEVNDIIISNGKIWAATEAGLASADLNSTLANPASWTVHTSPGKWYEPPVGGIIEFNGEIFGYTENTVFSVGPDSLMIVADPENPILGLSHDNLTPIFTDGINVMRPNGEIYFMLADGGINSLANTEESGLIALTENNGLRIINSLDSVYIYPESPGVNQFNDMAMDRDGNLWVATRSSGFMMFDGEKWTNFNVSTHPGIVTNGYRQVNVHSNGNILLSSWGGGMLVVSPNDTGYVFAHYDTLNSPFVDVNDGFVVVNNCAIDNSGTAWFANYGGQRSGPVLVSFDRNGNFHAYDNPLSPTGRYIWRVAVDQSGTKWMGCFDPYGLLYFNENNTPEDDTDDIYGLITTSSHPEMFENTHRVLEVDKLGMVWIGTDIGINVVFNPYAVMSRSRPIIRKLRIAEGQRINDIMVDALNNKWVATSSGVWPINPDGTETYTQSEISESNSPLPTSDVISLLNNPETGDIYFGTNQGLFVAQSLSLRPAKDYGISVYPQPFNPRRHEEVVIDGLASDSDLRITTINGELVRNIKTTSRKTVWDGRDESGNYVSSGVYLILAASATTDASAVAKIAVIEK
ncbi:MAG: two-component regulator propeller domain-containing protein [Candidatus Kapaibacterium sp.]